MNSIDHRGVCSVQQKSPVSVLPFRQISVLSSDMRPSPRILYAIAELYPYVKTGGLADVAASFPLALQREKADVRYFLPGYVAIKNVLTEIKVIHSFIRLFGQENARLLLGRLPNGVMAYVLDIPTFYERQHPYIDASKMSWRDNHMRFGAFCYAAANLASYDKLWKPDVFHGNDWHCGLIPAYKAQYGLSPDSPSVFTIHNIGYQGLFPKEVIQDLALDPEDYNVDGYEYYGQVGFMKAGIYYADHITTVSPTYAHEICTVSQGCGLEGLLSARRVDLTGILNGIDPQIWDPQTDLALKYHYGRRAIATRKKNKKVLLKEMEISFKNDRIVLAFIGRLTHQKGIDTLLSSTDSLLAGGRAALLIMGVGDDVLEQACRDLAQKYPEHVAVRLKYDEGLERRMHAGADVIVVPSSFEPCGLVQMYALRYGALPVVRNTGGLADTVSREIGFIFNRPEASDLEDVLLRAMEVYYHAPEEWRKMQIKGMSKDYSWPLSTKRYLTLYEDLLRTKRQEYRLYSSLL